LLTSLRDFKLTQVEQIAGGLGPVLSDLDKLKSDLPQSDKPVLEITANLVNGFVKLCHWAKAALAGEHQAERFLVAAKGEATIAEENLSNLQFNVFGAAARKVVETINSVNSINEIKNVAQQLQLLPVPVFYLTEDSPRKPVVNSAGEPSTQVAPKNKGPFVIKVMFNVERRPWSNSQILLANTIYDIRAELIVPRWPDNADYLLIDYITTLTPDLYRMSKLRLERPQDTSHHEFALRGHVEFPVPQNLLSEPMIIRLRATFLSDSNPNLNYPATIVGYHQLRVKVSEKTISPLLSRSGYKSIDSRNLEIIEEVQRSLPMVNSEHLYDFVDALNAVTNYMGVNLQQALYKGGKDVTETDFRESLLYHMRTWLGEEVQEAPRQGGGPTDIQFKSVTIELKVEKSISDRRKMVEKYFSQPVQYSSAGGAQLGILCILDLTEKRNPPANPQNQISLESPSVHGFPDGDVPFPTKIAAVIIDGNLRWPSSYSKESS
jgi:hypothetical protein